jgi:hypothetical protein
VSPVVRGSTDGGSDTASGVAGSVMDSASVVACVVSKLSGPDEPLVPQASMTIELTSMAARARLKDKALPPSTMRHIIFLLRELVISEP